MRVSRALARVRRQSTPPTETKRRTQPTNPLASSLTPPIPTIYHPVIPAKAGIQRAPNSANKSIAQSFTPSFPTIYHPVIPAKAGIQRAPNSANKSLSPLPNPVIPAKPGIQREPSAVNKSLSQPPHPVIPAKAGIQMIEAKSAIRSQSRIASDKSLPPLRGKARMGVSRAPARVRRQPTPPPETKRRTQPTNPLARSLTPSFPRKRESR